MSRRRPGSRSKRTTLYVLIALAITVVLLPQRWTGRLISIVQLIVPFQDGVTTVADAVTGGLEPPLAAVAGEEYDALAREAAALEHQIAALSVRNAELERDVEILTATRLWSTGGPRLGALGQLIPARVITEDLLPWRSSRLITAGGLQGVRGGLPVASRFFTVDRGDAEGLCEGMSVLLREVLVGVVDQVGTHTARVKLLSDVKAGMKVRIGRLVDGTFEPLDKYFWLVGRGNGIMEIGDADRRDVESGLISAGDLVLSDPEDETLPAAMVIGRIASIEPDRNNPLLSILTVETEVNTDSLRRVYVYVPEAEVAARGQQTEEGNGPH